MARQIRQESQRTWQFRFEMALALEQGALALTPRQCQTAENMLQQWEREEQAQNGA